MSRKPDVWPTRSDERSMSAERDRRGARAGRPGNETVRVASKEW